MPFLFSSSRPAATCRTRIVALLRPGRRTAALRVCALTLATTLLAMASFGSAPALAQSQDGTVLRVTAIPDESPTELARKAGPLMRYLEGRLGMKVVYTPVTDYAAAVETLVNRKIDLAWFGGFTFVQAKLRTQGTAIPIVQRAEDAKFTSRIITAQIGRQGCAPRP